MRGVPEPCLNEYTRINIQMTPGQAVRLIPSGFSRISISDALDICVLEYIAVTLRQNALIINCIPPRAFDNTPYRLLF